MSRRPAASFNLPLGTRPARPFVNWYLERNQTHFVYLAAHREIWDAFYCGDCSGSKWRLQQLAGQ
jgi:hypothetical protein